jgi:flagellar basal-body rod protein FlgB
MLDDVTSVSLRVALSALSTRQQTSADNLANIETPNFRASRVSFESSLRDAIASGDPSQAVSTVTATTDPAGVNGNNVGLDRETVIDEKTSLQYQLLSQAMSAKFSLIDSAVKG